MKSRHLASLLLSIGMMVSPVLAHAQAEAQPTGGAKAPAEAVAKDAPQQPARKSVETMMFTIDEYNDVQSRIATAGTGHGKNKADTAIESANLYLSSILYTTANDWVVWINGVSISPKQEFQAFQVTSITENYVELLVPLSAQGMRPVKLYSNQTFIAKTGDVVEGQVH